MLFPLDIDLDVCKDRNHAKNLRKNRRNHIMADRGRVHSWAVLSGWGLDRGDMMKIKTREDALLHCFDLWLWLAITGSDKKSEWPGWNFNGGYLERCIFWNCPTCEYTHNTHFVGGCNNACLLNWSSGNRKCNYKGGEFWEWRHAVTIEDRKKWALEIAILALEAM